eukprot:CAMPEP_0185623920 /NCGR_PEP_ID=MMETSP0436-20130131/60222_1 /TAXON_ID=626734 ORGANISM="Favella taraikaensis, Strain Fe Narragansett Bay" /NCGR_SAMPLE_ID=MMETSP0436 /ASSEMBLY_ACC=CAM_ASM_000390 /LENGTH=62 /DNA_ID=CAMNT_0028266171 /DNA_START=314 /DNA_END=502 /DNA_ORIENTATION=-
MTGHLRPLFAIDQDAAELLIRRYGPFGCLAHFTDALLLEHLNEVFLNSGLDDLCLLARVAID